MLHTLFRRSFVRQAVALVAGLSSLFAFPAAHAVYPDKPVRVLVGFSAGGTTDVIARILSKELTESLGQTFVVENKPGAGSNIAVGEVARAKPDGYTLLMVAVTSAINHTLYQNLTFDLTKDFDAVALGARVPNVLVVHPSLPVQNVKELVDYARANPGKLNVASSGSGTSIHMAAELFKLRTGLADMMHVPYKGSAPAIADLVGGQVQLMFDNMPSAWPQVQAGKLRALAVTTRDRSPSAPDLPTMIEQGFDDFDVSSWFGFIAPKGTPPEIVNTINAAVQKALTNPEVLQRYQGLGAVPSPGSPADFGAFIKREVETWAPVVKASGARVD